VNLMRVSNLPRSPDALHFIRSCFRSRCHNGQQTTVTIQQRFPVNWLEVLIQRQTRYGSAFLTAEVLCQVLT